MKGGGKLHDEFEKFFYQRLGKLRVQKGVSAMKMSKAVNQEGSYIGKVENKAFLPSMSTFFYICEYLGISPKEFFDTDSEFPSSLNNLFLNMKVFDEEELSCIESVVNIIKRGKKNRNN